RATARQWARLGPLISWLCVTPLWLTLLAMLYVCLQPHNYWAESSNINLHEFLTNFFSGIFHAIGTLFKQHPGPEQPAKFSLGSWAIAAGFFTLLLYLVKQCLKPNWLVADADGIQLRIRLGLIDCKLKQALWSEITGVSFQREQSNKLALSKAHGKLDIDLATIAAEDRTLLLKRIERNLPACEIDSSLSQSMLAKSDHSYTELWLQSLNQPRERKTLDPLEPGQLVADNRFEILRSLGVGGQGTAYLCREIGDDADQTIVLKETIIPVFADSSVRRKSLERFEKEAKLLKSLCHEGIVQLRDFFVEDHRAYLVLEHINGLNLRQRVLDQGPLDNESVRDLADQMCAILEFLHSHGVVHRDFTPDNLILEPTGRIRLIDFNVAQQIQAGSSGTIVGKHAYVPPEQFRGKATTQSDIYAFGATLFFLLTGKDPEPISQSSPTNVNDCIDEGLNQLVRRATALQPEDRYSSAEQIREELHTSQSGDDGSFISTKTAERSKVELNG
ncbi:MAG TPA: serine/threonine-protein kinase, partial [Chroococcales cyanobacterium]